MQPIGISGYGTTGTRGKLTQTPTNTIRLVEPQSMKGYEHFLKCGCPLTVGFPAVITNFGWFPGAIWPKRIRIASRGDALSIQTVKDSLWDFPTHFQWFSHRYPLNWHRFHHATLLQPSICGFFACSDGCAVGDNLPSCAVTYSCEDAG